MSDSFWSGNSLVPSWTSMIYHAWSGHPPKILETMHVQKRARLPPGCIMKPLEQADVPAVVEFWGRYFSITPSCRCLVPPAHVSKMISQKSWDGIIVLHASGEIIGSAVRRVIHNLHVREITLPKAAAADFYCIHPAWRKKGVGRAILSAFQNSTPAPTPPVLVLWDKPQIKVPPIITGMFMSRVCQATSNQATQLKDPQACKEAWLNCVKGVDVWSPEPGEEISFWVPLGQQRGQKPVIIWNTFHRTVPDGLLIGIVLSRDPEATEALAQAKSPWGVLLAPVPLHQTISFTQTYKSWKINSIFQWIGYNLSVGFISQSFPIVGF